MCKIPSLLVTVTFALIAGTTPLTAQWRVEPIFPVSRVPSLAENPSVLSLPESLQPRPADDMSLTVVGVAGAAVGAIGGAYLGYQLDYNHFNWGCEHGCEDPGIWGMVGGWFVGSALTTPLSVHLANGGQGSLSTAYVSSAVIAGAGMAGLLALGSPGGAFVLLGAPLAQVISAVVIERRVAQ